MLSTEPTSLIESLKEEQVAKEFLPAVQLWHSLLFSQRNKVIRPTLVQADHMAFDEVATDKQLLTEAQGFFNFKFDVSDIKAYQSSSADFRKL